MPSSIRFVLPILLATATQAIAQSSPARTPDELIGLNLTCQGSATWSQRVTDDNNTIGDFSDDKVTTHARSAGGVVQLRFEADGVAYRVASTLPGGSDKWRKLDGVSLEGDDILVRQKGLLFTSTVLKVDRRSGEVAMAINGGAFSGLCKKGEPTPQARQF